CAPPMPLSDCTRSSSEGSRPRPCCHRPIPPPCCSGHCSLPDRSTCARSMAGKRSPPSQAISQLTSPHDQIPSSCWRSRRGNSYHILDGTSADGGRHRENNTMTSSETVSERPWLYDRLGGVYSIATVVEDLIDRVMFDPML